MGKTKVTTKVTVDRRVTRRNFARSPRQGALFSASESQGLQPQAEIQSQVETETDIRAEVDVEAENANWPSVTEFASGVQRPAIGDTQPHTQLEAASVHDAMTHRMAAAATTGTRKQKETAIKHAARPVVGFAAGNSFHAPTDVPKHTLHRVVHMVTAGVEGLTTRAASQPMAVTVPVTVPVGVQQVVDLTAATVTRVVPVNEPATPPASAHCTEVPTRSSTPPPPGSTSVTSLAGWRAEAATAPLQVKQGPLTGAVNQTETAAATASSVTPSERPPVATVDTVTQAIGDAFLTGPHRQLEPQAVRLPVGASEANRQAVPRAARSGKVTVPAGRPILGEAVEEGMEGGEGNEEEEKSGEGGEEEGGVVIAGEAVADSHGGRGREAGETATGRMLGGRGTAMSSGYREGWVRVRCHLNLREAEKLEGGRERVVVRVKERASVSTLRGALCDLLGQPRGTVVFQHGTKYLAKKGTVKKAKLKDETTLEAWRPQISG